MSLVRLKDTPKIAYYLAVEYNILGSRLALRDDVHGLEAQTTQGVTQVLREYLVAQPGFVPVRCASERDFPGVLAYSEVDVGVVVKTRNIEQVAMQVTHGQTADNGLLCHLKYQVIDFHRLSFQVSPACGQA